MAEIDNTFWKDKKVLVTGAAGFIGSHLCEKLVEAGCRVRAFIRYNSSGSCGLIEYLNKDVRNKIDIFTGDILDEDSVQNAVKGMEIIYHLAALPGIPYSFSNPRHVFLVNTYGTFNVLSSSKSAGVKQVVLTSSAGASEKRPVLSPYIMSKSAMERVGLGFKDGLNMDVRIIRLMNNFGPGQSARAVIPAIIAQALVKEEIRLGALEPKMDFNFVRDTVMALKRIAELNCIQDNVLTWGTGINTSIGEIAELIFRLIGRKGLRIVNDPERTRMYSGPSASLQEDIELTHKQLGLKPATGLAEGLMVTIEWIASNIDHYKTEKYSI